MHYRKILTNQYSIVLIKLIAIPIFFQKNKEKRPACMLYGHNNVVLQYSTCFYQTKFVL